MTEKKTTRTLKSDTGAKTAKRLCNVTVKGPKLQAKKESGLTSKRTNSNPGPSVVKKAKLPEEEKIHAVQTNESSLNANDKAVGSINVSQKIDSTVPVKDSSSHQASYTQNVGQYDAQHRSWPVPPVAPVAPFDAGPGAQYSTLPVGHFGGTQPIAPFVRQPESPSGIQAGNRPNIQHSTQRANPYTESFFRDMAWTVTQNFPWELFAQEHGCTVPEVSVAFCALIFAILGDPDFNWKKKEHLTTAQFGNVMIHEWWKYYLSVLKPRGRMYQMMQPPTRTTIFTPSQGARLQTQMVETLCENPALGISHRVFLDGTWEELHARIKEEVELVERRWLENRSRR
ncbi:hypothetical protein CNMCM6936_001043 [Aspergillus lentulus]|nr:hypothetical protein CNMCM6936_001043 [Aspergillus lentulus]KAF4170396.1 hypothetical protein CNMCM8060_005544 [Aspergillus lentulus]KAF4178099.1 hypothetical protein CNMCM7927_002706 [Aspergillus lentulus]KAF4190332.1 hypothetical protein CNMCM8694_003739 [Aspergillus lentulus]